MTSSPFPLLARCLATAMAAVALVVGVAACGGGGDGVSATSIDAANNAGGSGIESTPLGDALPKAQARARKLMNTRLAPWREYLRATWGVEPKFRWTVLNESVARWRVDGQITGDGANERISAEWVIYLELDDAASLKDLTASDRQDAIEAANDEARKLDAPPPLLPGNDASLTGSLEVDDDAFLLALNDAPDTASAAERRGREAAAGDISATLRIKPGAGTEILATDGKPLTIAAFRRIVDTTIGAPPQARVTWRLDHQVRTRSDLEDSAPEQIVLTRP